MAHPITVHEYNGYGNPPGPPPIRGPFVVEASGYTRDGQKVEIPRELGNPNKHTVYPYVTGTSVIGITYKDGVLLAADTMGSYGYTMRYKSVERVKAVGNNTIVGASGEMSDFIHIQKLLDELVTEDFMEDDGHAISTPEIHSYLNRVLYNRRNKFDPLWNSVIIGGFKDGKPYLGVTSMIGVHYCDAHVASGFGNHLARPIFRAEHRPDMTEEEGVRLLEKCMRVLYYRDRSAINKIQIAKVTKEGAVVSPPYALTTKWDYKSFVNPTKGAEGSW